MSRIFDALQRSGTEQSGVEYPDLVSIVTEVFEAPREQRPIADLATTPEPVAAQQDVIQSVPVPPANVQTTTTEHFTKEVTGDGPVDFPSLDVSVLPSSRLVFLNE